MKRTASIIFILLLLGTAAFAVPQGAPVYGKNLKNGTYKIDVGSSSSMFRIVDCDLTVADGEMSAVITLSGTGYEKLFMGTGDEALTAPESEYIYFEENPEGKYTYALPVAALDTDIECAAFSIRKQTWYDRTLVFESGTLPEGAFSKGAPRPLILSAAAICAAAVAVLIYYFRKKRVK